MAGKIETRQDTEGLVFYEGAGPNRVTSGHPLLKISPTEIKIGSTTSDIDFKVLLGNEETYILFNAGDSKLEFNATLGGLTIGTTATGIDFTGTYTGNVIDFSNITMVPSGSGGTSLLRAGAYSDDGATCSSFISNTTDAQGGLIRFYSATKHQSSTAYDRGVFVCLVTTGTKGIYPIAGLAEVRSSASAYPKSVGAGQFIADLHTATSKVASRATAGTANFYGAVFKVVSIVSSEAESGSVSAPIWLDTQMNGTKSGETYTAYITTGHHNDAVFGFEETGGSGHWDYLFSFDDTTYDQLPCGSTRGTPSQTSQCDGSLIVNVNGKALYIPLFNAINLS